MIAKRVLRPRASSDFARLGAYILGGGQRAKQGAASDQTFDYILADQGRGRVGAVRITNCNADTPTLAIMEILATQSLNKRSRGDRTYHLVVSFEPGERPRARKSRTSRTSSARRSDCQATRGFRPCISTARICICTSRSTRSIRPLCVASSPITTSAS